MEVSTALEDADGVTTGGVVVVRDSNGVELELEVISALEEPWDGMMLEGTLGAQTFR